MNKETAKTAEEIINAYGNHFEEVEIPRTGGATAIYLPKDDALDALKEYGNQCAEQARREERERLKREIRYYRSTLEDIADVATDCPDTIEECENLLAHIQLDASWTLREKRLY